MGTAYDGVQDLHSNPVAGHEDEIGPYEPVHPSTQTRPVKSSACCVVCCSTLADTTRDTVVAAIAGGTVRDCPVFVVTDTPESCCPNTERNVVTDYVHPRRLEQYPTLTHRLLTAVESHRSHRQLERERQEKEAILTMLRTASSRDGVGGSFCEFLTSDREYHSVWIGTAFDTDGLTGQWACGDTSYTDAVFEPTPT